MVEVWRTYRGRADCENRIKELKADFGLDTFNLHDFWATEAALGTGNASPSDGWPWIGLLALFAVVFGAGGTLAFGSLIDE